MSASMIARGYDDDEIAARILAAVEAAAPHDEKWNWAREERKIRDLTATGRRKGYGDKARSAPVAVLAQSNGNVALKLVHSEEPEVDAPPEVEARRKAKPTDEGDIKSQIIAVGKAVIGVWNDRHGPIMHTQGVTYAYEGGIWSPWSDTQAQRLRVMIQEACERLGKNPTTSLLNAARVYVMDRPELHRNDVEFDAHGLLVADDAALDLATLVVTPHSPDHYALFKVSAKLHGSHDCAAWRQFLGDAFADRTSAKEIISALQEWFGVAVAVTRLRPLLKGLLAHGPSRSGKTQVSEVLRGILGEKHVCNARMSDLEGRFGKEPLIGKRGWVADDAIGAKEYLDAETYKVVVTGERTSAQMKGGKNWEGRFGFPVLLTANNLCRVNDKSDATYNRSLILPMTVVRPEDAPEPAGYDSLAQKIIAEELTGVLWWAIEGQLRTSFGQLASNIGKAQEGAKEQGKIFGPGGLNVDLGNARDGFKSLSDLLPTLVDRFSKIKDPARRAALETALFGEQGRRLDALLSGGTGAIEALGNELERTGAILSGEDIARSAKVAADLKRLGDQLERELASTVSHNAEAIETLATSLLNGASALLKFIDAFQRFRAQNQIASGDPSLAASGRATLNQTREGRAQAIANNRAGLRAIREGETSGASIINVGNGIGTPDLFGGSFVANTVEGRRKARDQLVAQARETLGAVRLARAANGGADTAPQAGKPGNLNVFAPDPKKGPKGKSAESIEAERLERAKRFATEEAQEQLARLGYLSDLTSDTRQQDEYARQRIRIEQSAKDAETRDQAEATINRQKLKGADAAIERARAEQLVKENAVNADLAIRVINQHEQSRVLEEQLAHLQTSNDILADGLNAQLALATTAKERATIEKRLLALSIESERAALQKQIDDKATTPEARADAIARRDALPGKQRDQEKVLDRQNEGPLARYRHTFDDPETQIEQAVADKLKAVDDAISDAASKVLGIKDPLLKSLLQIFLQQNVLRPLYDALQSAGHGGGGGIGGIFGSVLGAIGLGGGHSVGGSPISGSLFGLLSKGNGVTGPGFASGGSLVIGGNGGIDQNQLSLNGSPIARVGRGEVLSIGPNVAASNQSVRSASMSPIIIAPQHYDLSGVVMTETLVQGLREDNRRYADHVGRAAVQASGAQAPGVIQRKQTLGN